MVTNKNPPFLVNKRRNFLNRQEFRCIYCYGILKEIHKNRAKKAIRPFIRLVNR